MKKQLHEIWKEKEGSKVFWMVQAPKGKIAFKRKKDAQKWVNSFKEDK